MTIQGIVQNGVVVLPAGAQIPDGAVVSVTISPLQGQLPRERMTEEHRRKLLAALDAVAARPKENPGDTLAARTTIRCYAEPNVNVKDGGVF